MILRNVLLPGLLLPAVASALVLLVLWRRSRHGGTTGLAIAIGFLSGFVAISGWPRWLPVEATQRLFFLVTAIALLSWPIGRLRSRRLALGIEILAAASLLPLVLWALLEHSWTPTEATLTMIALFVVCLVLSRSLGSSLDDGATDLGPTLVRWALLGTIAVVLGLSDSFRLALLATGLASSVAAADLLIRAGIGSWRRSDGVVVATILSGLLLVGYFYAALGGTIAVLLVIALALTGPTANRSKAFRFSPLLPALLALVLAIATFLLPGDDPYEYSGDPSTTTTSVATDRPA